MKGVTTIYAILELGGKQYRVSPGDTIDVEKIDLPVGETVEVRPLCLVRDDGTLAVGPDLEGAVAKGRILENGRGPKIRIFKYKPKANYRRRQGHRQAFTRLAIEAIQG